MFSLKLILLYFSFKKVSCFHSPNISTRTKNTVLQSSSNNIEKGKVVLLIPSKNEAEKQKVHFGTNSPIGNPSLLNASNHLCKKINYFSEGLVMGTVLHTDTIGVEEELVDVDVVIAMYLTKDEDLELVRRIWELRRGNVRREEQCSISYACNDELDTLLGPLDTSGISLSKLIPWSKTASAFRLNQQISKLLSNSSDEFTFAIMLFFNQFTKLTIPWVQYTIDATWEKGIQQNTRELYSLVSKCGPCVQKCIQDPTCRKCINELNKLDTRDQVASYRTIVSFESDLLREFSFCILQKNNIYGCDATIPTLPKVKPIGTWRGKEVDLEVARALLVGNLDDPSALEYGRKFDFSWKVAAGANVAYDQFPSQFQLFYPNSSGQDMWYDPVFRVRTIDDRNVWCKRHYKVRNGKDIGTFKLSVLDNGVTSNEFWTVVGAADDLSWIVFHYAGAASAVGQKYLGGLLCTFDGNIPSSEEELDKIWSLFRSAGIEPWELFVVDNTQLSIDKADVGPPPLEFYRGKVLENTLKRQTA